jgi:ankyrin repeat protein
VNVAFSVKNSEHVLRAMFQLGLQDAGPRNNSQLLLHGADVNARAGECGSALQAAVYKGNEAIVQRLLDKGADVNVEGGNYGNALRAVSFDGNEKIVWLALENGAEVNAKGGCYGNALEAAAYRRSWLRPKEVVVRLLLDAGADINAEDGWSGSALKAARRGGDENIIQLLIERGASIDV